MKRRYVIFLIILICVIVYANSLYNPFIWDDNILIVDNPYIKNIGNFIKIFTLDLFHFTYEKGNYYRPVHSLTYMFDYAIWKLNPMGYHISNILLHTICTILIYLLILLISRNKSLSLIAALLFLVHPIHTEAVTYISGRADSLVAIFFLASLLLYANAKGSLKPKWYYVFSALCFIIALLSKEIAITLPFIIILYDFYFPINKKINIKYRIFLYLIYFSILVLYAFLRTNILNFSDRPILNIQADFLLRLITAIKVVIIYIALIPFPFNLHMERTLPMVSSVWELSTIASIVLLCLIIIFTIKLRKNYKLISFGCSWFIINLIPVLSIFMPTKNIVMAEHWLYLPSIGFFIILGFAFDKLIKINKKTTIIILISLLSFYSYLTIKQNIVWKDPLEFYKRIISFSPNSSRAHFNLGLIYQGKKQYDRAIEEYNRTLEIDPNYFLTYNNIGNIYVSMRLYDKAIEKYKQCLEIESSYFLSYNNLGNLYALRQEYDKAIEALKIAIKLNPYYSESYNNLGLVYLENNDYWNAESKFKKALQLNPENAEVYNNLGNLYSKKELYDEAIIHYKQAIKLKSDFDKAHFNLGVLYFKKNLIEQAKREWQRVLEINPNHQGALKNLELLK